LELPIHSNKKYAKSSKFKYKFCAEVLVGEKKPEGKPRTTLYIAIAVIVIILVAIGAYLLTIP